MRTIPRSYWTAIIPKPLSGDEFIGLPYFNTAPVGIEFYPVGKDKLYVYRNPATELNSLLKEATNQTGIADIDFNYAIAQNVRGAYVLRGARTKCQKTDKLKVLMLIGDNEKPSDVLKENQEAFMNERLEITIPGPVLSPGDANVHVFDLIELLTKKNFYHSRNDATYSLLVEEAVKEMQLSLDLPNLTGVYDQWIYNKLIEADREYIPLLKENPVEKV